MAAKKKPYHKRGVPIEGYWPISTHPLYSTWAGTISRCESKSQEIYCGRGIKVCKRWRQSFEAFVADMGPKPTPKHSIERKDNDKNYTPTNCIWATRSEQAFNRRKFKNNTTGMRGVVQVRGGRYAARLDYENEKYELGRFATAEEAKRARDKFEKMFFKDREAAIASISAPRIWCTSSTGVRGVTRHLDGGYIARATIDGVRHYVGYFSDPVEAGRARIAFIEEQARKVKERSA